MRERPKHGNTITLCPPLDDRVQRIARIDLAVGGAIDLFVLSDRPEARVPERGGRRTEVDPRNARVGARDEADGCQSSR